MMRLVLIYQQCHDFNVLHSREYIEAWFAFVMHNWLIFLC